MNTLTFRTHINAPAQTVWDIITHKESYEAWTASAFPGSTFEGEWKAGARIKFMGPDGSGTLAELTECEPARKVRAVHIAALAAGGVEDRDSDMAKGWIGTVEQYELINKDGGTEVVVDMQTTPDWENMFNDSWPTLLATLKAMSEQHQ